MSGLAVAARRVSEEHVAVLRLLRGVRVALASLALPPARLRGNRLLDIAHRDLAALPCREERVHRGNAARGDHILSEIGRLRAREGVHLRRRRARLAAAVRDSRYSARHLRGPLDNGPRQRQQREHIICVQVKVRADARPVSSRETNARHIWGVLGVF